MPTVTLPFGCGFSRDVGESILMHAVRRFQTVGPIVWVAALLLCGLAAGAEFNMEVTTAGIRPGGHVAGPEVSAGRLANRVVLLEFWGVNCPPCIRSMPLLEEHHKTFGPRGLVVIGAHAQGGTAEEVRQKVAELGVSFTILESASVEGGSDFQGIPHCMLFDHTGKCVFRGSPFNVEDALVAAVKAAPGTVLEGRTLVKLPEYNTLLHDERNFAAALKKVRGLRSHKDPDTAQEATFVADRIEAYGRRLLDEATSSKESNPSRAADLVQRCAAVFKGSDIGTEASKLGVEWRKDKQFLAAVKASQQLAQLEQMRAYVCEQCGADPERGLTAEMAAKIPPALKGKVRTLAQGIDKACPESKMAERAAAIATELAAASGSP